MRSLRGLLGLGLVCLGCSTAGSDAPGSGGSPGSGGLGGAQPTTSNVFVDSIVLSKVDKIDLLFMIDNSPSMADKQEILRAAVPVLLGRLLSPICVDKDGQPTGTGVRADGTCLAAGSMPEFAPIDDIHIGIVSSSLGAHGGTICADPSQPQQDDHAHLIGTQRSGLTSWQDRGFLAWDPAGTRNLPPGESNPTKLVTDFAAMVRATGEHGCGFEGSLESWYRFLIDPEPPQQVELVAGQTVRQGVDAELLAQREAFLRPDSLLAIVMLSDENDCSIRDDGFSWMLSSTAPMAKSTAACANNPNDECCRSCAASESSPPPGCMALSADAACKGDGTSPTATWDVLHDSLNLRCQRQQQRFGVDLLYPIERYVEGLKQRTLTLPSNPLKTVTNPIYATKDGKPGRDPSLVFLAGIVGVPWQDIATAESLTAPVVLKYLTARELTDQGRWQQLVGDPSASPPTLPSDPFMIESSEPRLGSNPNLPGQAIAPASSPNPRANAINGHEQNVPNLDDLQYACTFPLATPKECTPGDALCDCAPSKDGKIDALLAINSPLCQPPGGGSPVATQYFAKAYPGTRELRVLKGVGDNAIAASICPKVTTAAGPASSDPNYGYNPAIGAILDRLKEALRGKCLPRAIQTVPDKNGSSAQAIGCNVIEVQESSDCDCGQAGRSPAPAAVVSPVLNQLKQAGQCGSAGQSQCDAQSFCLCQINQETGDDLTSCVANAPTATAGFCYIDDSTSSALRNCPANQQQTLRFVEHDGAKIPAEGALVFLACVASPVEP